MTTMQTVDLTTSVAQRIKLVSQKFGMWRAVKQHKGETREENRRHGTVDAAKVSVKVCDHPALKAIAKVHQAAYSDHKRLTLPTQWDGVRMLPAGREFQHAELMQGHNDQHEKLVAEFVAAYPAEKESAPDRLKTLYVASMWPATWEIGDKFYFTTEYLSVPDDSSWRGWIQDSTQAAQDELRDRIESALERVAERCGSDGRLHATVFEAVRELTDLVPDFDFDGRYAPVVAAMQPLANLDAEFVREFDDERAKAAQKAQDILSILGRVA